MSRDVDENFHPVTEDDITALRLAVDASDAHDRAECWREVAMKLAAALQASGWTAESGGSAALEEFCTLLRIENRLKEKGRL